MIDDSGVNILLDTPDVLMTKVIDIDSKKDLGVKK